MTSDSKKYFRARFSEELVKIPICSTTPSRGVVLDPFAGSGTSLLFARKHGYRCIGIDIKREFCEQMVKQIREGREPYSDLDPGMYIDGRNTYAFRWCQRTSLMDPDLRNIGFPLI